MFLRSIGSPSILGRCPSLPAHESESMLRTLSRLQRETSRRYVGEAHSLLITAILLPQRLSCYWGKILSLRMLTDLRPADLRLTTAQQRTTFQDLPSDLYTLLHNRASSPQVIHRSLVGLAVEETVHYVTYINSVRTSQEAQYISVV
jgi:hypothetical protein